MRPDRDPAWENGQEAAVHAGSYGLTPADGQAQPTWPTGSQVPGEAWPVRAGLVPPLADGFITRPGDRARPGGRANTRGWFAWRGLLAYAIGLAAEWPFVSSRTTPARWSRRSAGRTSPGWSAGSPRLSSTCSWSP